MKKNKQKNLRLTSAEADRAQRIKELYGVTDSQIYSSGLDVTSALQEQNRRWQQAERDEIKARLIESNTAFDAEYGASKRPDPPYAVDTWSHRLDAERAAIDHKMNHSFKFDKKSDLELLAVHLGNAGAPTSLSELARLNFGLSEPDWEKTSEKEKNILMAKLLQLRPELQGKYLPKNWKDI